MVNEFSENVSIQHAFCSVAHEGRYIISLLERQATTNFKGLCSSNKRAILCERVHIIAIGPPGALHS